MRAISTTAEAGRRPLFCTPALAGRIERAEVELAHLGDPAVVRR